MRLDPNNIPPHIRRLMPATEPQSAIAQERRMAVAEAKLEKDMHDEFATWLRQHARPVPVPFVHSRMDKASTIREGWPDFTVLWMGRACCVEFKLPGGKLRPEQEECIKEFGPAGCAVMVCYDTATAMEFVKTNLF